MQQLRSKVIDHRQITEAYKVVTFKVPAIAREARPGQFIHLLIPRLEGSVLRRPFSIYKAEKDNLSVLYKVVGKGTNAMRDLSEKDEVSIIGPLGNGFPDPSKDTVPLLVAGGYGIAPLFFLATKLQKKGVLFAGGASRSDLLFINDFKKLGWHTKTTTVDGTEGTKGFVTDVLDEWLSQNKVKTEIYACGPDGMLVAVSKRAIDCRCKAWLSLDKHMGCGVGACLACVHKIKNEDGSSSWKRVCKDGPVFESRTIIWGKEGNKS